MFDTPALKSRWYRLTPDRLILALLALEGFLLLSEWFRWFAFNQWKGWAVLIALASVGLAFLLMLLWFAASLLFRWRFQFSIRSLLVLAVVVAIPCSWLAVERAAAKRQQEAVEVIECLGGGAVYDYEVDMWWQPTGATGPPGPTWLRSMLGNDFFAGVVDVSLHSTEITDTALENLRWVPQLHALDLNGTQVTDAGLEHLEGLNELQRLFLERTQVTGAGFAHLKELPQFHLLDIEKTCVTDAGLEHLEGLHELHTLDLDYTQVTDAGLEHLQGLTQLKELHLPGSQITDAGLAHLQRLTQLEELHLWGAQITDAGLAHLQGLTHLHWLNLNHTRVTDAGLEHLRRLPQLRFLNLNHTQVTDAGVKKLQQVLPYCTIQR